MASTTVKNDLRLGVWRWYAPAALMNVGTDSTALSEYALKRLLAATGFEDPAEIMDALRPYRRGEIPKNIQEQLQKIFWVDMLYAQNDPSFLFRNVEFDFGGAAYSIPYPLKAIDTPSSELEIAGLRVQRMKGAGFEVSARIGVATNDFLAPRCDSARAFCEIFLIGTADLKDELDHSQKTALSNWLVTGGLESEIVEKITEDDDARWQIFNQIWDRIEEVVSICGSREIEDELGNSFVLDGEEEKGFSGNGERLGRDDDVVVFTKDQVEISKESYMKVTVVIEGKKKVTIELGYDDISSVVSNLPDTTDYTDTFAILAAHPSISVRENVAGKDKLDESTVNILADDKDVAVIRCLVRSEKARECLSTKQLVEMINRDVDTAESIAGYVESYENAEVEDIAEALSKHPDPRVRNALAGNSSAPKKALKSLLKDEDSRVRASAKQSLD